MRARTAAAISATVRTPTNHTEVAASSAFDSDASMFYVQGGLRLPRSPVGVPLIQQLLQRQIKCSRCSDLRSQLCIFVFDVFDYGLGNPLE